MFFGDVSAGGCGCSWYILGRNGVFVFVGCVGVLVCLIWVGVSCMVRRWVNGSVLLVH